MPVLKLTYPGAPENWNAHDYIEPGFRLVNDWKIEVNSKVREADAWFVLEDLEQDYETCLVPQGMTLFGNLETCYDQDWVISNNYVLQFYNQFDITFTFNIHSADKTISEPPFLPSMVFANHGPTVWSQPNFETVRNLIPELEAKNNKIAVFCSNQTLTSGHRARIQFVKYLKNYFGDDLDWYGNGFKSVSTKWEVLKKYKYSVVLENQSRHNVITEKLPDAFLTLTYPFYWGAPNIGSYFDPLGFDNIEIGDFEGAKNTIENAIKADKFQARLTHLISNRHAALTDFNFLHRILRIVDLRYETAKGKPSLVNLKSTKLLRQSFGVSKDGIKSKLFVSLSKLDTRKGTNLASVVYELYVFLCHFLGINRLKMLFKK